MLRSWGSSDQVALSLHALDNGNFLWDNFEVSPEELAEILAKKLDPNKKEIVLLSCNDLASAQALAQATGKKVYTTDGAITIFENGIKRADNTKWYEVSPDGTAKELSSPPVKECSTCTGDGVEMGVNAAGNWVVLESKLISKLSSTIDATTLNKMIAQMKNAGDDGMKLALRIEKGNLESIDGYTSLIKNASVDNHSIKAVNQALDKADNLVVNGKSKELLRFEDNPSGYDIDLGVKTSQSSSTYSEAYQFKTNTTNLSKSSIQGASSQLYNAPTTKRIVEFKLIDGDNINVIKNSDALKTEFKFQLYDKGLKPTNNVVIDEFHLLSNTGEKVRVVYQDGNLKFINF
ncbi:hypothetical protein [Flavobacterium columnare]|uniref:Uncharacterized protein n=1 Tax=Flavobacterium columnare TaxID=996 RepID=A0AA94JP50_9FLAO|nr:hypothetical protein [Flavobacterium columnare]MCH4830027.1 hypothetical protein [Flavobacterium columnare]MCH4832592.1 hypothetical protein [Flavobacterium columnare]